MADQTSEQLDRKKIILQNLPLKYDRLLVKEYIEGSLDIDVDDVIIFPYIPGRALVVLKYDLKDFTSAAEIIKKEIIENQEVILSEACLMPAVVVTDIDFSKLEKEFLEMYLEVTFADCSDVINECHLCFSYNVAIVYFSEKNFEVVKKILANEHHIPLPSENYHIKIIPYFKNFHDHIQLPDNVKTVPVEHSHVGNKNKQCDEKTVSIGFKYDEDMKKISNNRNGNHNKGCLEKIEDVLHAHILHSEIEKKTEIMTINDSIDERDFKTAKDAISKKKTTDDTSDEQDEENSSDEQDKRLGASGPEQTSYGDGDNVRVKAKTDYRQNFDSDDSTDEIDSDPSDEKDIYHDTSDSKRFYSRGSWSVKSKEAVSKNNVSDSRAGEETESDSNDDQVKQNVKFNLRGTSYRGKGNGIMKAKSGTVKKDDCRNFDSDDSAKAEFDNYSSSDDQSKKLGTPSVRGTSYRGRGNGLMKSKSGTVKKEDSQNFDSDDSAKAEFDNYSSSDDQSKKLGTPSVRGTSYRGRGNGMMKAKSDNIKKIDIQDIADEGIENDNSNNKQDRQPGSYNKRAISCRGMSQGMMKAEHVKRNSDASNDSDEELNNNYSSEKDRQPGIMKTRGIPYNGRGGRVIKAKNLKSKNDVNSKTTGEGKLSYDDSCHRASNFVWGNVSNSTKIIRDHDNVNDEGSIESKNTALFSRGRGFAGRGRARNKLQISSMFSGPNDGSHCDDLSETKMSQNNKEIKSNSTFEKEERTKDLIKKVEELKKKKQEIVEENARLAMETHNIPLTELLALCLQSYMKTYNECDISYDSNVKAAILKGPKHKMQKCQLDFLLELKKIKETEISLNNDVQNILSSEKGHAFLQNLNSLELKSAFVCLDSNSLKVAALDAVALNEATKMLKEKIEYAETLEGRSEIPLDEINMLKLKIENNYNTRVNWDTQKAQLIILGIKDDVLVARKEAEMFLEKYGVSEKSFDLGEPLAIYFFSCLEEEIKHILKPVKTTNYICTKQHIAIRFQGNNLVTTQVLHKLEEMKLQSKILKWNLLDDFKAHEIFLIVNCFKNGTLKDIEEAYMYKKKCFIDFSNLSSFQLLLPESSSSHVKTKSKISKPRVPLAHSSVSEKSFSADELVYTVSSVCQLVINDGDIVQEKSDILVSILGTDLDLRKTRIGGSINRAYRSHWKEVKASYEKNPNPLVVTVKKPQEISCLAVCHIIFEPWDPNVSPRKLTSALQEVLNEAKLLGAKSISIPALGCGATFKFPPSNVAQIIFQVFQAENISSFLQRVVLLAANSDLSKELNHQATKHFNSLKLPSKPVKVSSPVTDPEEESSDESSDESDDDFTKIDDPSTHKNLSSTEIAIMTMNEKQFENLKTEIKKHLTEHCLSTVYFNQDNLKICPEDLRKKIVEKAKVLSVWVARSKHPKTKDVGFLIKGEKGAVEKMLAFIQQEFIAISSRLPQKRLSGNNAPKRGSLEFMQYASESDEPFPSYWRLNESKSYWENFKSYWTKSQKHKLLVDVDQETKDAVANIVKNTFDPQLVKNDKDALGLTHSSIKIINVQRVENCALFETYHDKRKKMFKKMVAMKDICPDIGKIHGSKGRVGTAKHLNEAMKKELFYEVNENYLFYGTNNFESVTKFGIDPRNSSSDGLFGKGIYIAEISSKADLYTDTKAKGAQLTLVLARVLLGNVFLYNHSNKQVTGQGNKTLSRPPCMTCFKDRCKCSKQTLFDSVMGVGHESAIIQKINFTCFYFLNVLSPLSCRSHIEIDDFVSYQQCALLKAAYYGQLTIVVNCIVGHILFI
ncbi:hypothetical protein Btru_067781 [Bulinus truncatus]|nr:hypothetical protein Btru_067781 [Bulinus truncatus]